MLFLVGGDGELGTSLSDGVSVLGDSAAGGLADGSNDLVETSVEGLILVGLRLNLEGVSVLSRALSLDGIGGSEGVAVASGRVDLNEHLSSSSGVGDDVGHINGESSSLRTLSGADGESLDVSLREGVHRAHLHGHADGNRIRVQLLQDGSELDGKQVHENHKERQKG